MDTWPRILNINSYLISFNHCIVVKFLLTIYYIYFVFFTFSLLGKFISTFCSPFPPFELIHSVFWGNSLVFNLFILLIFWSFAIFCSQVSSFFCHCTFPFRWACPILIIYLVTNMSLKTTFTFISRTEKEILQSDLFVEKQPQVLIQAV